MAHALREENEEQEPAMHRHGGQPTEGRVNVGVVEHDAFARALRHAPGDAIQRIDGLGAKLFACRGAPVHFRASKIVNSPNAYVAIGPRLHNPEARRQDVCTEVGLHSRDRLGHATHARFFERLLQQRRRMSVLFEGRQQRAVGLSGAP